MNPPAWTLLVLAAGMGRRFGGNKQLAPLGPSGEILSDYTLYDAARAGAARAVFVIRPDLESALREHHRAWRSRIEIRYPFQAAPRGTVDAVLAAGDELAGWSVVVNADDFYGRQAVQAAADWVGTDHSDSGLPAAAVIAYPLGETLSPRGGVSRAVLRVDQTGWLESVVERRDLTAGSGLPLDTPVSMNCWILPPGIAGLLGEELAGHESQPGSSSRELALPDAIGRLIRRGRLRVRPIPAGTGWIGVTHAEDETLARAALRSLVARGEYPTPLEPS